MNLCIEQINPHEFFNAFIKINNSKNLNILIQTNYDNLFEKYKNNSELLRNYFIFFYEFNQIENNENLIINNRFKLKKLEELKNSNSIIYFLEKERDKIDLIEFSIKFGFIDLLKNFDILYMETKSVSWAPILYNNLTKYLKELNKLPENKFKKYIPIVLNDLIDLNTIENKNINNLFFIEIVELNNLFNLINKAELASILLLLLYYKSKLQKNSNNEIINIKNIKYRKMAQDILDKKIKEPQEILKKLRLEYLLNKIDET